MLYYTPDAALPRADAVGHLGAVARALSAALELATTLQTMRSAERTLPLALAGSLALRGTEDVVAALLSLRDSLGELRQHPHAPAWFLDAFSRLAPNLSTALSSSRSLLAFGRGQLQKDAVDAEDVVADLRSGGVAVEVSGHVLLSGDAALLRQGLGALVEYLREADPSSARELRVRVAAEGGRVKIRVGTGTTGELPAAYVDLESGGATARRSDLRLALVQKIIEMHGGTLGPENDSGRWAAITLRAG